MIGLMHMGPELPPGPAIEVGWRLAPDAWGHGFAAEGGAAALAWGFANLDAVEIIAITAVGNLRSRAAMSRIGMTEQPERAFDHLGAGGGPPASSAPRLWRRRALRMSYVQVARKGCEWHASCLSKALDMRSGAFMNMAKVGRIDCAGIPIPEHSRPRSAITPVQRQTATVLFLDDQGWGVFEQMAAALKRRGVRTVRVTTVPPARFQRLLREPYLAWLADRLFYDERIHLGTAAGDARLRQLLDGDEVYDVVFNEPTLLAVGLETPYGRALTARSLAFRGTPPKTLLDKFKVNEALARAGVATPRQLSAHEVSPAEAVRLLGLPLVLKHPIGAAGDQVRVAHDLSQVETFLRELRRDGAPLFYQEHVSGTVVIYGAVIGADGGVTIEHGFRVVSAQYENGPSAEVTLNDTPELLAAGRKASALFGPRGFVAFGFIEAGDGRLLHIDANIRPWGMIAAPLRLGIDFGEAYAAHALGAEPEVRPTCKPTSATLPIFPHRVFVAAETWRVRDGITGAIGLVRTCARSFGLPYCGYILARSLLIAARGLRADRRARRRAARAASAAGLASATGVRRSALAPSVRRR